MLYAYGASGHCYYEPGTEGLVSPRQTDVIEPVPGLSDPAQFAHRYRKRVANRWVKERRTEWSALETQRRFRKGNELRSSSKLSDVFSKFRKTPPAPRLKATPIYLQNQCIVVLQLLLVPDSSKTKLAGLIEMMASFLLEMALVVRGDAIRLNLQMGMYERSTLKVNGSG
jgi:hypothetical protein